LLRRIGGPSRHFAARITGIDLGAKRTSASVIARPPPLGYFGTLSRNIGVLPGGKSPLGHLGPIPAAPSKTAHADPLRNRSAGAKVTRRSPAKHSFHVMDCLCARTLRLDKHANTNNLQLRFPKDIGPSPRFALLHSGGIKRVLCCSGTLSCGAAYKTRYCYLLPKDTLREHSPPGIP
jgi:hypothetical protein